MTTESLRAAPDGGRATRRERAGGESPQLGACLEYGSALGGLASATRGTRETRGRRGRRAIGVHVCFQCNKDVETPDRLRVRARIASLPLGCSALRELLALISKMRARACNSGTSVWNRTPPKDGRRHASVPRSRGLDASLMAQLSHRQYELTSSPSWRAPSPERAAASPPQPATCSP